MSILDSRDLEEELNNPDTDKERKKTIKELKKEVEVLKDKLEYEKEVKEAYKTFWLDTKRYQLYDTRDEDITL